jgi:lipid A 3-O-deacylase
VAVAAPALAGEAFVGVYKHDVTFVGNAVGLGAAGREDGVDVHLGYRTDRIESLRWLGKPQVHAMVSVNSENTSNFVAAGFDWRIELGKPGGFYLRPGMGLAYTDGETQLPPANAPNISDEERARRTEALLHPHRLRLEGAVRAGTGPGLRPQRQLVGRTQLHPPVERPDLPPGQEPGA